MLDPIRKQLSALELQIVSGINEVALADLDPSRSAVEEASSFLVLRFVSKGNQHCPFELHFGRGAHEGRFNFYVGLGAEFCNFEPLETPEDAAALAEDLRLFLTSTVRCERLVGKNSIAGEIYMPSEMRAGESPLKLTYKARGSFWTMLASREIVEYRAWL